MINYSERIDEVSDLIRNKFGVEDKQLIETLLAARIECQLPYPWLVLETDWFSLWTHDAWFAFGETEKTKLPTVASVYRTRYARDANRRAEDELFKRDRPLLIIEPEWERLIRPRAERYMWRQLMANCVHIRSRQPKRPLVDDATYPLLRGLVERALDSRFRSASPKMPTPPPGLFYWAELAQKLAIDFSDWHLLLRNLYGLAGRRAYLYNREEANEDDWALAFRVMHDSVHVVTATILATLHDSNGHWGSLRGKLGEKIILREMRRLKDKLAVRSHRNMWLIMHRDDVMALVEGRVPAAA